MEEDSQMDNSGAPEWSLKRRLFLCFNSLT